MRAASGAELALLAAVGYATHLKVEIQDGDLVYRDYRSQASMNWIDGVVIEHDIDQPVSQVTVTLKREMRSGATSYSLSPLREDSTLNRNGASAYAPAIDVGRRMRVSTACTAIGASPVSGDWKIMAEGIIDTVDFSAPLVTLTARDDGGQLVDAWFAAAGSYGDPKAAPSLETVAQQIIDDVLFPATIPLYTPTSPGDYIRQFAVDVESSMEALQRLVQKVGWDLRYRWDDATSAFRLTLKDPNRAKSTPDFTLAAGQIIKVTSLRIDRTNVRNHVTVSYGATSPQDTRTAQDTDSQERYGLRRIVDIEGSDSAIDTAAEAQALADLILSDLKDPRADHAVELYYYWPVDLHDLGRAAANNQHYDTAQDYAVVNIKHVITPTSARTTILTRGSPAGAYRQWLSRARNGTPPDAGNTPDTALNDFKFTDSADGTQRTFTWTRGSKVSAVFVHDTLEQSPPQADPWPDTTDLPDRILATADSYTVTKPTAGFQRFVQIEARLGNYEAGEVKRVIVDPAPSALTAKINASVASGVADLAVTIAAGVSDWPVTIDVFEDDPASAPIATTTLSASATITKADVAALGGRTRPNNRSWWVRATNVAGQQAWNSTASPANAPTLKARVATSTAGDAEDVYVTVDSINGENVRLAVRDSEASGAPVYQLVVGAADTTARYVAPGTELGPSDYFYSGTGSPVQKLSAIALTRDQVARRYLQVTGQNTGLTSTWVPVTLSLKKQPWLESIAATWDDVSGKLRVRTKGGANCASVFVEISDSANFASPQTSSGTLADGGELTALFTLSGTQRGKTWYARATPFNAVSLGGLSGVAQVDECAVPAAILVNPVATENTSAGTGTLTISVTDSGSVLDGTNRVKFYVTVNGTRALVAPTSAPGAGVTTGDFVYTFTLDPKHNVKVEPILYFADTTTQILGAWTFDSDKYANVVSAVPSIDNQTATINCTFDTDTAIGAGKARYRVDGGSWTTFTVSSSYTGTFTVTLSATAAQTIDVQGMDADGNWGPSLTIKLGTYDASSGAGQITFDPISGNESSQAYAAFTAVGPANARSAKFIASTSSQPSESSVQSTGTLCAASGRAWAETAVATVNLGGTVYVTVVPYTGTGGGGTALPGIQFKATFTTFGTLKSVVVAQSLWAETNTPSLGVVWNGSNEWTNAAWPVSAGSRADYIHVQQGLAPGVKLRSVQVSCGWLASVNNFDVVQFDVFVNGSSVATGFASSGSTFQTVSLACGDVTVTSSVRIRCQLLRVSGSVDVSSVILRDVTLNYVAPTNDKTV